MLSWIWLGYQSFIHPLSKIWLSIFILKIQRSSMSFKFKFGTLEDARAYWPGLESWSLFGYGHWSLIHPCSKFWRCMEHVCPLNPYLGFGKCRGLLVLDLLIVFDLGVFAGLWYTNVQNFSTPSKEKLSCLGEHYYHKILLRYGTVLLLLLKLAIYSQGQQKKINYSAPIRDIDLKFWEYAQIALT